MNLMILNMKVCCLTNMSKFGPALAIGDVDGDGLDDFYVGGAKGYPGSIIYTEK